VRLTLEDPDGGAPIVRDAVPDDFETTERGVIVGPLFVPWHRVIKYDFELRQEFATTVGEAPSRARIRIRFDDGSPGGQTTVVPADRFEGGQWTVSMLVDRHVEPEQGLLVVDKVFVPWPRVIEYERSRSRRWRRPHVRISRSARTTSGISGSGAPRDA
jgi:aromatic ring hydroxylase